MDELTQRRQSALTATGWLLTFALAVFRLFPGIVQPGMFFDGVTYATIARNMAAGVGSFWHPVFSGGAGADFHEQPPLAFWLESLWFRVFGDHYWVEKCYSATTVVLTGIVIVAIWRRLSRSLLPEGTSIANSQQPTANSLSWLPLCLWIALPGWAWIYENNMLENTLGLFAAIAVYAVLRADDWGWRSVGWTSVAAAATLAAFLSKGPVGLFPLAAPLLMFFGPRRQPAWHGAVRMAALVGLFGVGMTLLLRMPDAQHFLSTYFDRQVFASLAGAREHVSSALGRFDILVRIAGQIALPGAIAAILIAVARRKAPDISWRPAEWLARPLAFALLVGLSASLPIVLSPKQSGHYAFPAYPFYCLAIACWCLPAVQRLSIAVNAAEAIAVDRRQRMIRAAAAVVILFAAVFTCCTWKRPARDKDVYYDTLVLVKTLPRAATVGLAPELADDWPLQNYLARWDEIETQIDPASPDWLLTSHRGEDSAPPGYEPVPMGLTRYRLFQRIGAQQTAEIRREKS